MLTRRRFMTITATALALGATRAGATPRQVWAGQALGARASIRLDHPDAAAIAARAANEISRLSRIFSLYEPTSQLVQLNQTGRLDGPAPELLECLTLAGAVHDASGGLFDPTIQPLWALWAERASMGLQPTATELAEARSRGGWSDLRLDAAAITLRPGMGLTLNGIAQGYIADRIAVLLSAEGLTNILIDTGEHRALGQMPEGRPWPVTLAQGGSVPLRDRALATSAPLGTVFDAEGRFGHILHPATGAPATVRWSGISISAPRAGLADALSTAACLAADRRAIDAILAAFPEATCLSARQAA